MIRSLFSVAVLGCVSLVATAVAQEKQAFEQAIAEKRLIEPAGNNAWEHFERMRFSSASEAQKAAARKTLVAALRKVGDDVISNYLETPQPPAPISRGGKGTAAALEGVFAAEDFERAARYFELALELAPDQRVLVARAQFCRGRALVARGRWAEAEVLLREAVARDPAAPYSHNALGVALLARGRTEDALYSFQAAVERAPRWVYARHNLALAYFHLQRFAEAEREWVVASVQGQNLAFPHVNLGVLYLQMGRRLDAERELKHALQLDPEGPVTNHNLAVLYDAQGRLPDAESRYRKVLDADPRHLPARLNLADLYRRSGRPAEAERELLAVLNVDARSAPAWQTLGDVQANRGKTQLAIESYREALALTADPETRARLERKITALAPSQ